MHRIAIQPLGNLQAIGQRWQALERHAATSFFTSWTHLGCLAEQRFTGARLLAVTQDGADVALALLGRGRGRWWLNQTGDAVQDSIFIEHNGVLAAPEAQQSVPAALHAACRRGGLVLSGIDDATLQAAGQAGWLQPAQSRWAPAIHLHALTQPYLETLSANTRAQIRRSQRLYGPDLSLSRAETPEQAQAYFAAMVELHQAAWRRRDQPGAFAEPGVRAFHTALIARAWPLGQADLLCITAGQRHIGTLYTLIRDGTVNSYQSGFAPAAGAQEKPGLVCHALAVDYYRARGARVYDLLAGADRYKRSLAQDGQMLHWGRLFRPWSPGGLVGRARQKLA